MPNWEKIRKEWETSDITFKALAEKHGVKDSTIRSRKNREKWQRNNATQQKKNVATEKNVSWAEIENVYVTDISRKPCTLKDLAEKYDTPFKTIEDYSYKNKWREKREKYKGNVREKHREKSAELISDQLSKVTARHFQASDKLLSSIEQALRDDNELYKYVEKLRQGHGPGSFSESIEVETLDALNESKVLNLANSLEKIQKLQRQSLGILDEKDKHKIEMDKRKLGDDDEEHEDDGFLEALDGKEVNWDEET